MKCMIIDNRKKESEAAKTKKLRDFLSNIPALSNEQPSTSINLARPSSRERLPVGVRDIFQS